MPRAILRGMRPGVIVGATIGNARIARAAGAEIDHLDTTPYQFSQPMDLAEYLVPVHADIPEIGAILLDGFDDRANARGVKGVGELADCGANAAIVRAMFEQPLPRWLAWATDPEQVRRAPFLSSSPLFTGLPRRLLARLSTRFFEKVYHPGEVVFEEGDPGRALFVVVDGAVEITRATPQGSYVLNTLGPGDAFGELALIDDFPRSATARVVTPGRLLILYKSDFDALMEGNARIAVVMMRNLSRRLAIYARRPPGAMSEPGPGSETAGPL